MSQGSDQSNIDVAAELELRDGYSERVAQLLEEWRHFIDQLDEDQAAGLTCCNCGSRWGAMRPVAPGPRGQLFAHADGCCS